MNKIVRSQPPTCLIEKREIIDGYLDRFLPPEDVYPEVLHRAIRYSVMAGGKRLRPILALTAFEACGGSGESIFKAAVALELIHTYSLIHDDLPCMDDDELRRGKLTLHKEYGEAVALLAGDALHDLAFNLLAQTGSTEAILELADAIGTKGMLAGQMADMEAEGRSLTLDEVMFIHTHKTGKLIRSSVRIGAVLAGADEERLTAVTRFAEKIGYAFQIIDDILDIEGDVETLGKPVGSDVRNFKATFPAVIGLEESRRRARELTDEAVEIISSAIIKPDHFVQIARFIESRQN